MTVYPPNASGEDIAMGCSVRGLYGRAKMETRAWPNTDEALSARDWIKETWGLWTRAEFQGELTDLYRIALPSGVQAKMRKAERVGPLTVTEESLQR